jgi:hypothetical protein
MVSPVYATARPQLTENRVPRRTSAAKVLSADATHGTAGSTKANFAAKLHP